MTIIHPEPVTTLDVDLDGSMYVITDYTTSEHLTVLAHEYTSPAGIDAEIVYSVFINQESNLTRERLIEIVEQLEAVLDTHA